MPRSTHSAPAAVSVGMVRFPARAVGLAATVLALASPAVAGGQSLESVAPSARIRVDLRAPDSVRLALLGRSRAQPVVGTLTAVRGDTVLLTVGAGAAPVLVPRTSIATVYASRGRPPRWQSALRSALVPALAGAALRGASASIRRGDHGPSPAEAALTGAAISGAFGAVKGALFPNERWQRLALPSQPAIPRTVSADSSSGRTVGSAP